MRKTVYLLILIFGLISCSTDDDPQELEYEFIAEYRTDVLVGKDRIRGNKIDIGDVTNPDFQYELIEEYLNNNFNFIVKNYSFF